MRILYQPNEYTQQRQREKKVWIYPVLLAMEATYYCNKGHVVDWITPVPGRKYDKTFTQPQGIDFLSLPFPDRRFSRALDKRYQVYGNYKYHPATHFQVADGCWHGKCTFCIERDRQYKIRPIDHILAEIDDCRSLGIREMFDDSGTFPDGLWNDVFCDKIIRMKSKMVFGCNMRIGAKVDWGLMKAAGFRMILFGIESFNQKTLDRINKGVKSECIIPSITAASRAGLEPHIAIMLGLPGEEKVDEDRTVKGVHYLLRNGYAKTAQASVYHVGNERGIPKNKTSCVYGVWKDPRFWFSQFRDIRTAADIKYLCKKIKKGVAGV